MKARKILDIIHLSRVVLCALACLTPGLVLGADEVLVRGQGVVVTTEDVLADAERIPDELRASILGSPDKLEQLAGNLYVRRVLAKRGREAGLQNEPRIIAVQQLAVDKIFADAYLAKAIADAQPPSEEALERMAQAIYATGDGQFFTSGERRVRHILISKTSEDAKGRADAKARADEVLEKLRSGADFATLAKEYSADPGTRDKGGDLGFFSRGRMVKPFEDAAFGLATPGDLAVPVETPFGFHVLRLEEIRPAGKKPYDELRADIKRDLRKKLANDRRIEIVTPIYREGMEFDRAAMEAFARQKH